MKALKKVVDLYDRCMTAVATAIDNYGDHEKAMFQLKLALPFYNYRPTRVEILEAAAWAYARGWKPGLKSYERGAYEQGTTERRQRDDTGGVQNSEGRLGRLQTQLPNTREGRKRDAAPVSAPVQSERWDDSTYKEGIPTRALIKIVDGADVHDVFTRACAAEAIALRNLLSRLHGPLEHVADVVSRAHQLIGLGLTRHDDIKRVSFVAEIVEKG